MRAAMVQLKGMPAAPGLAAGPLVRIAAAQRSTRRRGTPAEERKALAAAIGSAQQHLASLADKAGSAAEEGIVAFQLALLEDDELTQAAFEAIAAGEPAEVAWELALDGEIADYESSQDPYFRGRAADLVDLRDRVLDGLLGGVRESIPPGAIVVADDLAPSRFLATEWHNGGLVLNRGSTTSHVAILARARGVPMLVGIDVAGLGKHAEALLDAQAGVLILDPDPATRSDFERRQAAYGARLAQERKHLASEARTSSGARVQVMINIAGPEELSVVDPAHVDGIGLVRTELLFHGDRGLPDEEEQYRVYRRILQWAGGRPVTIRTLDAGGDKPIPGLTRGGESNPFLGVRGVRLSLRRADVFHVQLRALARAALHGNLKVMLPMVTAPSELERCRAMLQHALSELSTAGVPAARPPLGIMVEVPACALAIEEFDADFYSIGSNDLIQYLAAASRDEPELSELAQPGLAFWRAVGAVAEHAARSGREVSLCGDLASDPRYVQPLLDAGLRCLSVAPAALAGVKAAIARC